jgi:hypothetical protein
MSAIGGWQPSDHLVHLAVLTTYTVGKTES